MLDDLSMLDVLFDGVIAIDARGTMLSANAAALRMFGYASADDLVGRNVKLLMPEPYASEHDGYLERYQRSGEPRIIGIGREVEGLRRDGSSFPLDLAVTRGEREDGAPYFLGVLRDLTERRETLDRLAQAEKLEAIGQLAGGIAHDFNNLLTSILGSSELLVQNLGDSERLQRAAQRIHRAAERGASLTQRLLAFGRRQMVLPRELDVNAAVRSAVDLLHRVLSEDVAIQLELDDHAGVILADPTQVDQIVMNLAINGADAMPGGGALAISTARVELAGADARRLELAPGRYARIRVADTGTGIPEEQRSRIFEPFFTTKDVGRGTGLGLSTVYGICKQSGGAVEVESEVGAGSRFDVYWPSSRAEDRTAEDASDAPASRPRAAAILLVEDDELVREATTELLEDSGYSVVAAADPEAALRTAAERAPDLLITDLIMPEMSGSELAERLAERHPGLRVLMISGYSADQLGERGMRPRGPWLDKPFSNDALLAAVRAALEDE